MASLDAIEEAKQLLQKPQRQIEIDNVMVVMALKMLSNLQETHANFPSFWEVMADAQLLSGQLTAAKESLQRIVDLKSQSSGNRARSQTGGNDKARKRSQRRSMVSSASEVKEGFVAPFSKFNMFRVEDILFSIVKRGTVDLRVRFFLANIYKVQRDFDGCVKWLSCDALDDSFLQRYIFLYGKHDFYSFQLHAWMPKRIFEYVADIPPGHVELNVELEIQYYSTLLAQAADVDQEQMSKLQKAAVSFDPNEEVDDEEADQEEREHMMLLENDKDIQMWRLFRGSILREEARHDLAEKDLEAAVAGDQREVVTLAAHLQQGHILYETGEIVAAMELYDSVQHGAKALRRSTLVPDEDPHMLHFSAIEADALAGMARISSLQGEHEHAEDLVLQAHQADDYCGDALLLNASTVLLRGDLPIARNLFSRLHNDREDREARMQSVVPALLNRKWLRLTQMKLENLTGEAAVRREEVKESGGKDDIVEKLDGGRLNSRNGEEAWQYLLCFIAEQQWSDCLELLEMMAISFGDRAYLPLALAGKELNPKADAQSARRQSTVPAEVAEEEDDESALLQAKVAKLISRGSWLERSAGWSMQALGDLSVALGLLNVPGGSSSAMVSREPSSSSTGIQPVHSMPSTVSSRSKELEDLYRKTLWKRHKVFLGRGNASHALADLEGCVACLDAELGRERTLQMLGRSLGSPQGKAQHRLAKCWYSRGVIKYKQFKHEDAEKCFREATKDESKAAAAKGYLGLIYSYRGPGHRRLAIQMLRQSLDDIGAEMLDERIVRMKLAALLSHGDGSVRKYQAAIDEYSTIIAANEDDSEALAMRAGVHMLDENWEAAVLDYTASLEAHGTASWTNQSRDRVDQIHYWRGRALQHLGLYHRALVDYEAVRGQASQGLELLQNMAFAHEAVGNIQRALDAYDSILQVLQASDDGYLNALQHRAALSSVCNKTDQALRDLNLIVQMAPSDMQARYQRGCTLCAKYAAVTGSRTVSTDFDASAQLLRTAIEDFNFVLRENPHNTKASLRRRAAYNSLREQPPEDRDLEEGMQSIEGGELAGIEAGLIVDYALRMVSDIHEDSVVSESGERIHSLLRLISPIAQAAKLENWAGEHVVVDRTGQISFANKLGAKQQIGHLGQCTAVREDFNNGLFAFRLTFHKPKAKSHIFGAKLLRDREDLFRAVFRFSNVQSKDALFAKPIYLLEVAYRRSPEDMVPLYYIGRLCEQQNQASVARANYMRVLTCLSYEEKEGNAPQHHLGHFEKKDRHGQGAHVGHGELDEADRLHGFTEGMIRLWPGNAQTNLLKSDILYRLGMMRASAETASCTMKRENLQGAIRLLRHSINLDANHKFANFNLGVLLLRSNHAEEAVSSFKEVVRLDPDFAEAHNNLGLAYSLSSHNSEALHAFEDAVRLQPDMQVAICNLSIARLRAGMLALPDQKSLQDLSFIGDIIPTISHAVALQGPSTALALSVRGLCFHVRNHHFHFSRRSSSDGGPSLHGRPDLELARDDYMAALDIDDGNLFARACLVLLLLQKNHLGSAFEHLEVLTARNSSDDVVAELGLLAAKVEMAYAEAIADFETAVCMNPCFAGLSLLAPNVDLPTLCNKQLLGDLISSEMKDRSTLARSSASTQSLGRSKSSSAALSRRPPGEQCLALALVALSEGNYAQAQAQFTNVMSWLPADCEAQIHVHIWRAQALHLGGNFELAIEDAERALVMLKVPSAADSLTEQSSEPSFALAQSSDGLEGRSRQGSVVESRRVSTTTELNDPPPLRKSSMVFGEQSRRGSQAVEMYPHRNSEVVDGMTRSIAGSRRSSTMSMAPSLEDGNPLGVLKASASLIRMNSRRGSMESQVSVDASRRTSMTLDGPVMEETKDTKLVYALLCYLGALRQSSAVNDEEGARRCYRAAKHELPNRVEAHMNLGILEKRARRPEHCMTAFLGALRAMLTIEQNASGSEFQELHEQLVSLMSAYQKEWRDAHEASNYDVINIEKKQGELLLLAERFELVIAERTGESASHRKRARMHRPDTLAREEFMREAVECGQLLRKGFQNYSQDPTPAFNAVYARYSSAVDNLFYSLATYFPEDAAAQEKELQDFENFSDLQTRKDAAKEDPSASLATIHFASKLLHLARPGHANELKVDRLSIAIDRVRKSLDSDGVGPDET